MGTSEHKWGLQGCTISLMAAVHPGHRLRALITKKKKTKPDHPTHEKINIAEGSSDMLNK